MTHWRVKALNNSILATIIILSVLYCLLFVGCVHLRDDPETEKIKGLIQDLKAGRNPADAAYMLGEMRDSRAVRPLIAALRDQNDNVRISAVKALGKIQHKRAVKPLITALNEENYKIRREIRNALTSIGQPAVKRLIAAMKDKDEDLRIRHGAASSMKEIDDARVVPALIDVMMDTEEDLGLRTSAGWILGDIKDQRAVEPLIAALKDRKIRYKAVRALGETKDTRAIAPLIGIFKEDDGLISPISSYDGLVIDALVKIGEPAVEPLIAFLQDKQSPCDGQIRIAITLGEIGDHRAIAPLIALLQDENKNYHARKAAAQALGEIGDKRAVGPLASVLKDKKVSVRYKAAQALGKIDDLGSEKILAAAIEDKDLYIVAAACRYYIRKGYPGTEDVLIMALNQHGTGTIARRFYDCSNPKLRQAALDWLESNERTIDSLHRISDDLKWGSDR